MSALDWEASTMIAAQAISPRERDVVAEQKPDDGAGDIVLEHKKKKVTGLSRDSNLGVRDEDNHFQSSAGGRARASAQGTSTKAAPTFQLQSPDSSLIFERSVQESTISPDAAIAIPAHLKTDDQIPPALQASSLVITDSLLGPEEVEIVTHASHQPAAAIIAESINSPSVSEVRLSLSPQDSNHAHAEQQGHEDDSTSNYGSINPSDARRVSFISFADVVQAEQAEHAEAAIPTTSHNHEVNPTQSPTRSSLSYLSQPIPQNAPTPPTSISGDGSAKGIELSPTSGQTANQPATSHAHQHGELSIETLGQALRKTASMDLSGSVRPPPTPSCSASQV